MRKLGFCYIRAILSHPEENFLDCDKRTALESLPSPDRLYKHFNVDSRLMKTRGNSTLENTRFLGILEQTLSRDFPRSVICEALSPLDQGILVKTNLMRFEFCPINLLSNQSKFFIFRP